MKYSMKNPRQQRTLTMITVILVVIVGAVSSCLRSGGEDPGYLSFHNEGYLTIRDASGTAADVYYAAMKEVVFFEEADFGTADTGALVEQAYRLGRWNSPQLGSYLSCTRTDVAACVWIRTDQDIYVVNLENGETTQGLYRAILKARDELKG